MQVMNKFKSSMNEMVINGTAHDSFVVSLDGKLMRMSKVQFYDQLCTEL